MPSSNEIDIVRQVFICLRPETPNPPPPLHTVYVYTVYCTYSQMDGRGRVEPERRLEGQPFPKQDLKY